MTTVYIGLFYGRTSSVIQAFTASDGLCDEWPDYVYVIFNSNFNWNAASINISKLIVPVGTSLSFILCNTRLTDMAEVAFLVYSSLTSTGTLVKATFIVPLFWFPLSLGSLPLTLWPTI